MQVRAKLAKEWSDQKEARFKQCTDRFVDLRARYINQLDAEITGRALAKRTFDTSCVGEPPFSLTLSHCSFARRSAELQVDG